MLPAMSATNGPFAGELSHGDGATKETLPEALAAALVAAQGRAYVLPVGEPAADEAVAREVFFRFDAGGVRYEGELAGTRPWRPEASSTAAALATLGRVGRCLARIHARELVHGDLHAEMLRVDDAGKVTLLVPAHASAPGAVLRARLHPGGAAATAVVFAAPEVAAAAEVTPAADVYGLAALAYLALTGYAPLGQVNLRAPGAPRPFAEMLDAALNQVPAMRPTMEVLAAALEREATAVEGEALPASAYRSLPSGRLPVPEAERPPELSPVLMLVLLVGGVCAFAGAVLLVVTGWDVVGAAGQVATLFGLAALSWGASLVAARLRLPVGVTVARGVAGLFATVAVAWAFALLDAAGRLGLLSALTVGAIAGGFVAGRRGAPLGGAVLLALGSQLLWAVGAQAIAMSGVGDGPGVLAALAAGVSAVTFALALYRRSGAFGVLAALDVAVFAGELGAWMSRGSVMGPPAYGLAVAAGYALLAGVCSWREAKAAAVPMALGAAVAAGGSALSGLWVLAYRWETHGLAGAAWPFVVAAAAAPLVRAPSPLKDAASFVAGAVVVFAPTIEALLREELGFTVGAVVVGAAVLAAAVWRPELRERDDARAEALLAGMFGVTAAPALRLFHGVVDVPGEWMRPGEAVRWALVAGVTGGLLALSYAATRRVSRARYRLLEVGALAAWFGLVTVQVLCAPREVGPAALALVTSAGLTALGATTRRAAVMLVAAAALAVHLWVQYFVRLEDVLPLSVRLVGFGVGLLVGGVLYEQQVRHRLSRLKEWG